MIQIYYYIRESFTVDARYFEPRKEWPKSSRLQKFELAVQQFKIAKRSGIITQQAQYIVE